MPSIAAFLPRLTAAEIRRLGGGLRGSGFSKLTLCPAAAGKLAGAALESGVFGVAS